MPTFENPAVEADELRATLRAPAHATRSIDDPRQIYSVLGSLTSAVASLSQSLHQLAVSLRRQTTSPGAEGTASTSQPNPHRVAQPSVSPG